MSNQANENMPLLAIREGILNGVGDEFIHDQSQRNSSIGVEPNTICTVEMKLAVRVGGYRVITYSLQVGTEINVLDVRIIGQPLVCAPNSGNTTRRLRQLR